MVKEATKKARARVVLPDEDYIAAVRALYRVEGGPMDYRIVARTLGVHPSTARFRLTKLYIKGRLG